MIRPDFSTAVRLVVVIQYPARPPLLPLRPSCSAPQTSPRTEGLTVSHVSLVDADLPARDAILATLAAVARDLKPLAASFFLLGDDGEIRSSVVHGSHLPPLSLAAELARWKVALRGVEPLAPSRLRFHSGRIATAGARGAGGSSGPSARRIYRDIGAINDVRLLIRDGGRLVAGVTVWRKLSRPPWTRRQLARLAALQPLAESSFLASLRSRESGWWTTAAVLSPRWSEVAKLLARGATTAEIARALSISPNTAKSHVKAVLTKLGAGSRRQALLQLGPHPPGDGLAHPPACVE